MTSRVAIRPRAERDPDEHFLYIAEHNAPAAERFLAAAKATLERLAAAPELGGPWQCGNPGLTGVRIWRISDFEKYLVFYRPIDDGIDVIRVLHGARDIQAVFDREE